MWTKGKDWYWSVGESAIEAIFGHLAATRLNTIGSVLDFGCGWGRVARQLRRAFPDAKLYVCDLNEAAAGFCADTFDGHRVTGDNLPRGIDLIWVGSVFTHLARKPSREIFDTLIEALAPNGLLVATTHGRRAIEISKKTRYIKADKWENILHDYRRTGYGYASYDLEVLGDYGVSLSNLQSVFEFGEDNKDIMFAGFQEAGWANHQDVFAWTKRTIRSAEA